MKPDQLRYFMEAARHQHIGKAARMIPISASAISHSIAALEEELGRELFVKRGKRIYLTEHGKLLMERAERLLREIEAIREDLSADRIELRGHYKVGATHVLCSQALTPAWARLQRENPKLTAEVYTLRSAQVLRDVASGKLDFGLCFNPQAHPGLDAKAVHHGTLVLAVRKGHPLLQIPLPDRVQAMSQYPASLPKAFQGIDNCESHPMFKKFHITPQAVFLFDSFEVAAANVINSNSWSLLPDWIAETYKAKLVSFVPKDWRAPAIVTAIWPKSHLMSRLLSRLIIGVQAQFKPARGAR